jgi:hypothetical protein
MLAAWGAWRRGGWRGLAFGAAACLSLVAALLPLRHVSELYAYAVLPLVGVAIGFAAARPPNRTPARVGCVLLLALLVGSNAVAARARAAGMDENGRRAATLLADLAERLRNLPANATVALVDPKRDRPNYSVFRVRGFLLVSDSVIARTAHRPDLRIVRVAAGEPLPADAAGGTLLTMDREGRVMPIPARDEGAAALQAR